MGRIAEAWRRIRSIEGRETLESGLDEEMRFHIDQQTEKHRQAGMGPAEARRLARLKFGGMEGVKEIARDEFRPALLEDSVRDVRHGLRVLRRAPALYRSSAAHAGSRHRRDVGDLQRGAHRPAATAAVP